MRPTAPTKYLHASHVKTARPNIAIASNAQQNRMNVSFQKAILPATLRLIVAHAASISVNFAAEV